MNANEVNKVIKASIKMWPGVPWQTEYDADMLELWTLLLSDVSFPDAILMLVNYNRSREKFPPTPGELAGLVKDEQARADGTAAPDVDEAWTTVMAIVNERGWYAGPPDEWPHPAVTATAKALTWNRLCHGDPMTTFAHFKTLYTAAVTRITAERKMNDTVALLDSLGIEAGETPPGLTP